MPTELIDIFFFFFNDTATTEIYTLSLHDALPISMRGPPIPKSRQPGASARSAWHSAAPWRSEEHTSELQSRLHLVCRLLLEKKKKSNSNPKPITALNRPPSLNNRGRNQTYRGQCG